MVRQVTKDQAIAAEAEENEAAAQVQQQDQEQELEQEQEQAVQTLTDSWQTSTQGGCFLNMF